jgi:hypothetical protein
VATSRTVGGNDPGGTDALASRAGAGFWAGRAAQNGGRSRPRSDPALRPFHSRGVSRANVNGRLSRLIGVQAKTGREYALPINEPLWEIIRRASGDRLVDFTGFVRRWGRAVRRAAGFRTGRGQRETTHGSVGSRTTDDKS